MTFDIRRVSLWLNKEIILNKKELLWKEWNEKGINQINDIVNSNGTFLTHQQIERKFNI
jgi:post-segregation antitoxin (ccd killing protein)